MSVYVDSLRPCLASKNWRYTESAHLFSDSEEELLVFGKNIGLKESWLQHGSLIHFDLTRTKRRLAVLNGAVEVDAKFVTEKMREARRMK